jgi:hypothetical protein
VYLIEKDKEDRSTYVLLFSTATVLLASLFLYLSLTQDPYSAGLKIGLIVTLLLSALSSEVLRHLPSASEIKRALDASLDFVVYASALYSFSMAINPPLLLPWVGLREYMLLFLLLVAGAVLHTKYGAEVTRWLRLRAERLLIFTLFLIAGFYYSAFEASMLLGLGFLVGVLYLSVVLRQLARVNVSLPRLRLSPLKGMLKLSLKISFRLLSASARALRTLFSVIGGIFSRKRVHVEQEEPEEEFEEPYRGHRFTVMITDEMENPISGARVVIQNKDTGLEEVRVSDSSGRCTFEGIAPGLYRIIIDGEGIAPEEHERYISMDHGEVFAVKLKASDLSVVVSRRGLGTPVRDARVVLISDGSRKEARTNNLGVAYFDSLEVKEYLLEVEAAGYERYSRPISLFAENVVAVALEPKQETKAEVPQKEAREESQAEEVEAEPEAKPKRTKPPAEKKAEVKPAAEEIEITPEEEEVIFGESALIEYTSDARLSEVVASIVREHIANERDVFLVSMQPRTAEYRREFAKLIGEGRVRVINLATKGSPPKSDSGIEEVPIANLEYFNAVFEEMPAGALFIFEPLSSVVLTLGAEHAYRFISRTAEHLSNEGLFFICFINKEMHSAKEVSSFRELFMNVAEIKDGRIRRVR